MTIDTKNLRVLAEDCMNREIDFDDVSPNQGSTSCDKLTRAYFRDANPAAILALLDALERKDRVIRSIKQEAETALVIGDEIGMRDGLVQILKEADQEFGITTRN